MQRGTTITVFSNGLRISEEDLASIGIFDGSTCWGLWVPDRNEWPAGDEALPAPGPSQPPHFLISPFEPSSWPILFRVEMCLGNDRPGTLGDAVSALTDHGLSILSIEATPAGHHHAVVTIIGEAMPLKAPNGVLSELKTIPETRRTFRDAVTWRVVHETYAPEMLRYSKRIVDAVEKADDRHPFLREIFLDSHHPRFKRGVLYSYGHLPRDVDQAIGSEQRTRAVRCTWLQNLAFFWLYGQHEGVIELHYKSHGRALKPAPPDRRGFGQRVEAFHPPFKAIASFHLFERFLRVVLSPSDLPRRTARVTIPFSAKYRAYQGSQGFQRNLFKVLKEQGALNLREVSMLTRRRNLEEEEGELSLLVSRMGTDPEFASLETTRDLVQRLANEAGAALAAIGCRMNCDGVRVERFESPLLFVSTKFDWMRKNHPDLRNRIAALAQEVGFRVIMGDTDYRGTLRGVVPEITAEQSVTGATIKLIQNSAAFLQIIPKLVLERGPGTDGSMNWLEFEFGAAQALEIPCAIMVDLDGPDISTWKQHLRVADGFPLFEFHGSSSDETSRPAIENAVHFLGRMRRRRRLP